MQCLTLGFVKMFSAVLFEAVSSEGILTLYFSPLSYLVGFNAIGASDAIFWLMNLLSVIYHKDFC